MATDATHKNPNPNPKHNPNNITVSKDTDDKSHQISKNLEDLKEEINKAPNKNGFLGSVFITLHKKAPPEDAKNCYGRLGKIVKEFNND